MKLNMKILGLLLISCAAFVIADYAQTTIYFAVPSTSSFTNAYLDGGINASGSYPPTIVGASYYFNSSTGYSELIQPCIGGTAWGSTTVTCQSGVARPAIITTNTGTVAQDFWYEYNTGIPTGWLTCINGTKRLTADSTVVKSFCTMGDLNATGWAKVGTSVAAGKSINVTIYANASNAAGGTNSVTLYTNSTT